MWTKWQNQLTHLFYVLLITVILTVLMFFGAFVWLDEWAYDNFERLMPNQKGQQQVLLIEVPPETHEQGNQTWLTLLERLQPAKQIVFTFLPKNVSSDFYCQAKKYGNVFFARLVQADNKIGLNTPKPSPWTPWLEAYSPLSSSWTPWLQPLPEIPAQCEINFGLVDIPPHTHGIHRRQYSAFQFEEQAYPALEVLAAEHFLGTHLILREATYPVYFGTELEKLPKIKLDNMLNGSSVNSDLIEQRSVIVGFARPHNLGRLHTPLSQIHDVMISMPEYHALALNTLLNDRHITALNSKIEWLLLLLQITLSGFLYHFLNTQQASRFTLAISGIYILLAWLLYRYTNIWLPIVEMILAQWLLYWFDFKQKLFKTDTKLRDKLVDKSFKLADQSNAKFLATEEYWSQIIVMLHEMLNLNRLIILECLSGYHYFQEIKALHCSLADIDEQQRDDNRQPYTIAIQKNGALLLTQPLLKPIDVAEQHYLVPLVFGGEVLGFWALTIENTKCHNKNQFEATLKDLSLQLAESLFHRQQGHTNQNELRHDFQVDGGYLVYQSLNKSITALENRLSALENIIAELDTPTIIYDVFGLSLSVNKSMNTLSQTFKLTPHQSTVLEFLMTLCHTDIETARHYFRHIMLEGNAIVQQVTLTAAIKRVFNLNLQLFYYQEATDGNPLNVKKGILCQLVDITQMKLQNTLKEQVAERLIYQFRNDMQSIMTASKLLSSEQSSLQEKRMVAGILQGKVNSHLKILNEVETQLNVELDASKTLQVENYPIDAKEPVLDAIEKVHGIATEQQIKIHHELPALVSLVFAAPNELSLVIASILTILIDEAAPNTDISITMEERDKWMTYTFKNSESGIPNERLQQYLFSDDIDIPDKFNNLRRAIKLITHWKGTLTASNQTDHGLSFELRLRSFI
ncbi:MAG: hypothetical protein DRR00_08140 [Candidatus Parabeggiatoa sp. nov. 3]|nr:MAG: hypothetical protein DRR00_08140 [Gammaproteobacteria bacterium]